tara:strand:+ start:307 stop:456 length:150 start_codon:yes stop_codon:yes gene_type:complete
VITGLTTSKEVSILVKVTDVKDGTEGVLGFIYVGTVLEPNTPPALTVTV